MTRHDPPELARRRFFEAALDVWAEKGFHAARMDEIAARAGRSKGSLYHHFSSKQELLVELVGSLFGEMQADLGEGLAQASSAGELLRGIIDGYAEQFAADPRMLPVFAELVSISAREEDVHDLLAGYYRQMVAAFEQVFAWGVATGEFRADLDVGRAARVFAYAGDGAGLVDSLIGEDGGDTRATLAFLVDVYLRGIAGGP